MADEVVPSTVTQWTFKTLLIVFFLMLLSTVGYLYKANVELHDEILKISIEAAECKGESRMMRK